MFGLRTVSIVKKNARASTIISAAGILLPFGLGAGIAVPIYDNFVDKSKVSFGYFLLFVGVAISITAFPVLCRILTELRLLDTDVGIIVLSAGVGNDVVGWILLALTVALVNAGSGLTALWVLLTCVGFIVFLLFPVKWAYRWLTRFTGSLDNGTPTTLMMTVTLILVFSCAFFTDIIGMYQCAVVLVQLAEVYFRRTCYFRWIPGRSTHSERQWIFHRYCRKARRSGLYRLLTIGEEGQGSC